MDKQSLHETQNAPPLGYPLSSFAGLFGPEFDVFKIGGKIFYVVVGATRRPLSI